MASSLSFLKPIAYNTKEIVKELKAIRKILEENNTLESLPGDPDES